MDLLGENRKKEKTKNQKLVLGLLITSIILLVLTVSLIAFFIITKPQTPKIVKLKINNADVETSQDFLVTTTNGEYYIELKELAQKLDYTYYNGAYLEFSENKEKCYIDNGLEIIGMEKDSKNIYKTAVNNTQGYQYFEISRDILYYNDKLYVNALDLPVALNLIVENGSINTVEKLAEDYKDKITKKGYSSIDSNKNNLKAIAYNLIVVNKDSKKGIINRNLEEIVGTKYNSMEFIELANDFIVSSNNKYGIIKTNGETKVKLIYDDIKILSYSPLLYVVKKDNKFGIINEEGDIIADTTYDKIGYDANKQLNIENTIIIPEIVEGVGKTIVVSIDKKYGLIDIDKKAPILDCIFEAIYISNVDGTINYVLKQNGNEYNLLDYMEYAKTRI